MTTDVREMPFAEELRRHTRSLRLIGGCNALAEFVLAMGDAFAAAPRPDWLKKGEDKQCFSNSTHLALNRRELSYVEGVAMRLDLGIPMHHAWCVTRDGTVVDPTWSHPEDCRYVGVMIDRQELRRRMFDTGVYGVLDPTGMGLDLEYIEDQWGWRFDRPEGKGVFSL